MAVYGIDLGTTYSCIARSDGNGGIEALQIADNSTSTPSVVTFDPTTGRPIVGANAKNCMRTKPECTKAFVKRDMHKDFCDEQISVKGVKRPITPIEVQACILRHLVKEANILEKGAGHPEIKQAVITVPAKFDEIQRARTKLAAELAGIQVLGLLQEPTAAAIAYDIPAGNTVLVFDLGGGTLDVSIVRNEGGHYIVLGTPTGDGHLGGVDWDEVLLRLALRLAGKEVPSDPKKWNKLMNRTEECKKLLSQGDADLELSDDDSVEIEISDFENASQQLLDRCMDLVDNAIKNAKAQDPKLKIDFFLTVGGSSKMPMIRKTIVKKYGAIYGKGRTEDQWLRIKDPDTAIAIGAAKYAQMLSSGIKASTAGLQAINDKATHSYGIKILKQGVVQIKNIVKSTEPMVYSYKYDKLSLSKNCSECTIEVFENTSASDYANFDDDKVRSILRKSVNLDKEYPRGTSVSLQVERDANGLIHLQLTCNKTVENIDVNCGNDLITPEIRKVIEDSISLI